MGRSPGTVFSRTVTLLEAFRRHVRAVHPSRPALADEIQGYDWDYFQGSRWWFETHLTSDEVIAVNEAFRLLDELVAQVKRIRGALGPSKPAIGTDNVKKSIFRVMRARQLFEQNRNGIVTLQKQRGSRYDRKLTA
jgi:hypothetical protein